MHIDFSHLIEYKTNIDLPFTIITQYYRFEPALKGAIKNFMTKLHPEYALKKIFYVAFHNLETLGK